MPISVTDPTDGTAMSWASLATQFATMRTWVNAVPDADVVDGSVTREHLVRPVTQGFPVQAQRSTFREYRWQDRGIDVPQLYDLNGWSIPERLTICPRATGALGSGESLWYTPIGETLQAPGTEFRVWFSCAYQVRMDPNLWAPAGALTPKTKAGELQIRAYNRSTGAETTSSIANIDLYSGEYNSSTPAGIAAGDGTLFAKVETFALFTTVADDVYVVFKRTRDNVDQVDLARISFQTEVF